MNFFFKQSKIVIDCLTTNINAFDYFPIQKSASFYPNWWKNLPKYNNVQHANGLEINKSTMKGCDGLLSLYSQGFMIPIWSDLVIETQGTNYRYQFADETSIIGHHDLQQMSQEFSNFVHVKIQSPWRLKENKGIKFAFIQPSYNQVKTLLDWQVLPGVVDFKYQSATNINLICAKGRRFEIAAGLPMAQLIPLSEKEIDLRLHMVDFNDVEHKRMLNNHYPFFVGSHRKLKKILDNKKGS